MDAAAWRATTDHCRADITRRVKDFPSARFQQLQQTSVLLSATAAEADDVNRPGLNPGDGFGERPVISCRAVHAVAGWRIDLVQREPFLRLLDTVIMKLVVHLPRAQGREQVVPDVFRKLAGMNRDVGSGLHAHLLLRIFYVKQPVNYHAGHGDIHP